MVPHRLLLIILARYGVIRITTLAHPIIVWKVIGSRVLLHMHRLTPTPGVGHYGGNN